MSATMRCDRCSKTFEDYDGLHFDLPLWVTGAEGSLLVTVDLCDASAEALEKWFAAGRRQRKEKP